MAMPIISSSPLKTAQTVSGALAMYLSKYCEVATGSRVVFQGFHGFGNGGWYRFRCNTCHDNWNMKTEMFADATSCPKELGDWLEKHQHVCQSFHTSSQSGNPRCLDCGWAWNKHKAAQPQFNIETGEWVAPQPVSVGVTGYVPPVSISTVVRECVICNKEINRLSGVGLCETCYSAAKHVHETKMPVKPVEGRMFRAKEDRCELATDSKKEMSPDSANSVTPASQG